MRYKRDINHRCRIVRYWEPSYSFALQYRLIGKRFNKWKEVARIDEQYWHEDLEKQLFALRKSIKIRMQKDKKF